MLEGVILKPNMVLPGLDYPTQAPVEMVAAATIDGLRKAVTATVAGVAFLSGRQSAELASARLDAMNAVVLRDAAPWPLVFSFARAIQQPALDIWCGKAANANAAQQAILHRARCNHAALSGLYDTAMELDRSYRSSSSE